MRTSKSTKRTTIDSRDALEQVFGEYAQVAIEQDALRAELDERIRQVRESYEDRFAVLAAEGKALLDDIVAWASGHPEEFKQRKRLELLHGAIGFRQTTPRVVLRRGTDEEALAADLVDAGLDTYVRIRRELDRQRILASVAADDAGASTADVLGAYGIKVRQSERFYAEVKREEVGHA